MNEGIIIALISSIPASIGALAAWRQVPTRPTSPSGDHTPSDGSPQPSLRRDVPLLKVSIILVAGAIFAVGAGLVANGFLQPNSISEKVMVSGLQVWTDTRTDLEEADDVRIVATGEVFHAVDAGSKSGPAGEPGLRLDSNVIRSVDHNALIGKIGETGPAFFVGEEFEVVAPADGRLFLGVNDVGVDNNAGAYRAEIRIKRP